LSGFSSLGASSFLSAFFGGSAFGVGGALTYEDVPSFFAKGFKLLIN